MLSQARRSWALGQLSELAVDFYISSKFFFFFTNFTFSETLLRRDISEQLLCPTSKAERLSPLKKQYATSPAGKASQRDDPADKVG